MSAIMIGFFLYLVEILLVGLYTSRITRGISDFAIGDRKLGPWVIAFSERASGESAWLIIGLLGVALMLGLVELWTVIGCLAGYHTRLWDASNYASGVYMINMTAAGFRATQKIALVK